MLTTKINIRVPVPMWGKPPEKDRFLSREAFPWHDVIICFNLLWIPDPTTVLLTQPRLNKMNDIVKTLFSNSFRRMSHLLCPCDLDDDERITNNYLNQSYRKNLWYKQMPKLKCFSSRLAVVFAHWSCSWSSTDRRCSNYIYLINNFIIYCGVPYIRGLTAIRTTEAALPHKSH